MKRIPQREISLDMRHWKAIQNRLLVAVLLTFGLTAPARAQNAVTDWNLIAITAASNGNPAISPGSNTPGGSGIYMAYVHLAIFNAVNAVDRRYQFYGPDITAPTGAEPNAAAIAAAYYTLAFYFPDQAASLNALYTASLAAIPDSPAKDEGIQVGYDAANGIMAMRSNDGRGANVPYTYPSVPTPGVWIPTPPGLLPPQTPWIGKMLPFTMTSASQFLPDEPPPDLASQQWADDYNQVKALGAVDSSVRTPQQTEIGLFWSDHTGRQYARTYRALATAYGLGLSETARLFAMLYAAAADSFIGCLNAKYYFSFWRPITAIRNGNIDGNSGTIADPNWTALAATPNHPEYPAAHGCVTGAVANTLKGFFGNSHLTLVVTSSVTGTTHTFTDTHDLENEVEWARIYAGFHYHHSIIQGFVLGRKVSQQVLTKSFQPIDKTH